MHWVSINKHRIAKNNKGKWVDPVPCIRISDGKNKPPISYVSDLLVVDEGGRPVAWLVTTSTGEPVLKCGAKVALVTLYDTVEVKRASDK